ncbi:hypothetical protein CEB3_c12270 [Peptococcaceae bacterium CEB3]|nr:hypothetical protein CEB3_c12270 [Peptococcaceae bacterium CEB3]
MIAGNLVLAAVSFGLYFMFRKSKRRLSIVLVVLGLGCVVNAVLFSTPIFTHPKPPWFTPRAALLGVQEQWQIQQYHVDADSPQQFTLDLGLAYNIAPADYSFWLEKLSWHKISTSECETLFGKTTTDKLILTHNSSKKPILYDFVIPGALDDADPATKVGYGLGNPKNVVDSVVSLPQGNTLHLLIIANTPIQWTATSVDPKAQTVSFTWVRTK